METLHEYISNLNKQLSALSEEKGTLYKKLAAAEHLKGSGIIFDNIDNAIDWIIEHENFGAVEVFPYLIATLKLERSGWFTKGNNQ